MKLLLWLSRAIALAWVVSAVLVLVGAVNASVKDEPFNMDRVLTVLIAGSVCVLLLRMSENR
jgi:peptidoglycan/LPS O-acetylase OafA/YrhL